MPRSDNSKQYDLEERTFQFAKASRVFVKQLPEQSLTLRTRNSLFAHRGSIGANYIEANECIGKKDFLMKIKTCRREAKETGYWLRLLDVDCEHETECQNLIREAGELMNIFGAIVRNFEE